MPSIFIWKSNVPNTSTKKIKYHMGSNWILEDTDYSSKSYIYLEQIVIPGFNDSVITFHIRNMPINWVGSDLLEIIELPYKHIKTDNYGTLEMIGDWIRFTLKNDIDYNSKALINELITIKEWSSINNNTNKQHTFYNKENKSVVSSPSADEIQLNFQNFLIKYSI
jgi:hypothetical protein